MASLAELREEITYKRGVLSAVFSEAGPDLDMDAVTSITGTSEEKAAEVRRLNAELGTLKAEMDRLELLEQISKNNQAEEERLRAPAGGMQFSGKAGGNGLSGGRGANADQALRKMISDNKDYREFKANKRREVSLDFDVADFKTLITLSTINVQPDRRDLVTMALEERTVADLMLQGATDNNTLEYYEETTFTNNAGMVAEGVAKPESELGYTLRQESVRKIAHFIPATKEAMDDVPFLETQIRGRLAFGVRRKEEQQLLSGSGAGQELRGLLNRSGLQTQAKGADPTPDAIYKAMQKIRGAAGLGFAEPTAVVFHPNDWTEIKLLRTADGIYLWGNPSDEGPDRIWGLPVRQTTGIAEGTALVGAFRPHAEVIRREGITITLSTEHASYFVENKVAILAEERLALAVYRPSAFCTVTGI
jgi:HK97 family phage major capsid protein